jgi:hypothetical protein
MIEQWKHIIGYEGLYQISNLGNVKSIRFDKEKLLLPQINSKGYYFVVLCDKTKRKQIQIHQLVAMAFLNHIPCKMEFVINHINFDKKDNKVSNLEIVTNRENSNRKHLKSTSEYTGVSFEKDRNKWTAQIKINGKRVLLGRFLNEIDASNAYQSKLKELTNKTTENPPYCLYAVIGRASHKLK